MRYLTMIVLAMLLLGCGDDVKSKASEETKSENANGVSQQEAPDTVNSNGADGEGSPQPDVETGVNEEASNEGKEVPDSEPLDYHEMTIEEIFYSGIADITIYPVDKHEDGSKDNVGIFTFFRDGSTYFGHSYLSVQNTETKFEDNELTINYTARANGVEIYIELCVTREEIVLALDKSEDDSVVIKCEASFLKREEYEVENTTPLL